MSLPTTEGVKNSYPLVRSVVASTDRPPELEEFSAEVTPLCVKCRTKGFVNLACAKILTDKFILRIDEYSLKVFPVAFAMYNAFYWMDWLWKYIGTCFFEMISKILEFETINKLEAVRALDRFILRIDKYKHLEDFPFCLCNAQCFLLDCLSLKWYYALVRLPYLWRLCIWLIFKHWSLKQRRRIYKIRNTKMGQKYWLLPGWR